MKKIGVFNWKKYITQCLESTDFCCISTVDSKGVWSNPVYFAWDNKFILYFISQMRSRHMQNLSKIPRIAVAIYKTEQKGDVAGIQLEGTVKILTQKDKREEIQHAYDIYYGRAGKGPDVQDYINNPTWYYVKVIPEQVYYFDTRFFGEERQKVPLKNLF